MSEGEKMKRNERATSRLKRDPLFITEFIVEVYDNEIRWGGLDRFLWWLMHSKPGEKLAPAAINRMSAIQTVGRTGRRP